VVKQAVHKSQVLLFDGVKKNILANSLRMR